MRIVIVKDDGVVGVDGVFYPVDLSDLPANVHAVQWQDTFGHVEFKDGTSERRLMAFGEFATYYQRWEAARDAANVPPPPPTPEQLADEADKAQVKADQQLVNLMLASAQTINDQIRALLGDLTTAQQRNALITLQVRQTQVLSLLARAILR